MRYGVPNSLVTDRGLFLHESFGHCCVISQASNKGSVSLSICRLTVRRSGKTAPRRHTFKLLLILCKTIGQGSYPWLNLSTIMPKNAYIGARAFELNCGFIPRVLLKKDVDAKSKSRSAETLRQKPRNFLVDCRHNSQRVQDLQTKAYNTSYLL